MLLDFSDYFHEIKDLYSRLNKIIELNRELYYEYQKQGQLRNDDFIAYEKNYLDFDKDYTLATYELYCKYGNSGDCSQAIGELVANLLPRKSELANTLHKLQNDFYFFLAHKADDTQARKKMAELFVEIKQQLQ